MTSSQQPASSILPPSSLLDAVFSLVANELRVRGIGCLLVGGFAVNHYGYTRSTLDVDFMIATDDLAPVRGVLVAAGFSNVTVSDNVVFFERPGAPMRVDFLQVDAATMLKLLTNAASIELGGHRIAVPALRDLLAMKLFAAANAGGRRLDKDLPDVAHLCAINGLDLEADLHPLCRTFATETIFDHVAARVRELQEAQDQTARSHPATPTVNREP